CFTSRGLFAKNVATKKRAISCRHSCMAAWVSNVLRSLDYPCHVVIRIHELHGNTGMTSCEHAEDFISKCLPDPMDVFEVENDGTETVDPQQKTFGLLA